MAKQGGSLISHRALSKRFAMEHAMNAASSIIRIAAALVLFGAPLAQAWAGEQAKTHHKVPAKRTDRCPNHRTVEGEIVDCHGWRLRDGDWDNSCFNLDYLPSQFACSSRGRR
jgi:hypothetical protein